jgi:hypothetical protein
VQIQLSLLIFGENKKIHYFYMKKLNPEKPWLWSFHFEFNKFCRFFFNAKNWETIGIFLLVQIQLSLFNFLGKQNSQFFIYEKIELKNPDCDYIIMNSNLSFFLVQKNGKLLEIFSFNAKFN